MARATVSRSYWRRSHRPTICAAARDIADVAAPPAMRSINCSRDVKLAGKTLSNILFMFVLYGSCGVGSSGQRPGFRGSGGQRRAEDPQKRPEARIKTAQHSYFIKCSAKLYLELIHSLQSPSELSGHGREPPHLNWSSAMFRKRRTDNDEQTTEARRDYHEVEAS